MITYVWAEDLKHQIGLAGHLPWHLPADMRHFKEVTMGHPIVMGRKTFLSLPRVLPGRQHIVLTKQAELAQRYAGNEQVAVISSLSSLNHWLGDHQSEQICVIGGATIFQTLKEQVDCLEKTEIRAVFKADTVMPSLDYSKFELLRQVDHCPDTQNKYSYVFKTFLRKE